MTPLYVDSDLLVLDKPSGLLAVPGRRENDCLSARAQVAYADALVVHRLDQDTSGLMVMARGAAMQRALSMAFAARSVEKRYVASVAGRLDAPTDEGSWGVIALPLLLDWPNRPRSRVDPVHGKPSVTRWRVLGHAGDTTRLELAPVTGRSHQLRVHLAAIGHPILGDPLYAPAAVQAMSARLLLHASELAFQHPGTGEALRFESAAPF